MKTNQISYLARILLLCLNLLLFGCVVSTESLDDNEVPGPPSITMAYSTYSAGGSAYLRLSFRSTHAVKISKITITTPTKQVIDYAGSSVEIKKYTDTEITGSYPKVNGFWKFVTEGTKVSDKSAFTSNSTLPVAD